MQLSWSAATDTGTGVARYIVKRDGTEVTTSASIVGTTWTDIGRPRGTNPTYTVQAIDGAGNIADLSNARTASIALNGSDTVKPAGAIISPDGTVPISGQAIVQINATDNVGVAGVSLWSGPQKLPGTFTLSEDTVWEGRFDSTKFPDGSYPVEPHIVDAAGNEFVGATVVITIRNRVIEDEDKDAPSTPVLKVTATGLHTADAEWTLSEDASGGEVRYQFELDGDVVENDITALSRALSGLDSRPRHTARVIAYDPAGNTAASALVPFTLWAFDTAGPTITLGTPGTGVLASDPQAFRFTVRDDDSGVQAAELHVAGLLVDAADRLDGDVWGTTVPLAALPAGTNTYRIRAVDLAGNVSWSNNVSITVPAATPEDTTGPVVVITQPADGSVVRDFLEVLFAASDVPSGVSSGEVLTLDGLKLADAEPLSAAEGTWVARVPKEALPVGASQFVLRVYDRAPRRNFTDVRRTVVVEAPEVIRSGTFRLLLPPDGITDALGLPVSDGTFVIDQAVSFNTPTKRVTRTPRTLDIEGGMWVLDDEEVHEVAVPIPPASGGIITTLETPGASPESMMWKLPDWVEDGSAVRLEDLLPAGRPGAGEQVVFLPSAEEALQASAEALAAAESVRLTVAAVEAAVRNQPADYSRYGYQETPLNDPAPFRGLRLIFQGDSITVPDASAGVPEEKTYAHIVANMLASGENYRIDHVGGSTTADVNLRLLDSASPQYQDASNPAAARPANVVVLNNGTNDAGFGGAFESGKQMFKDGLECELGVYQSLENLHTGWTRTGTWTTIAGPFSDNRKAQLSTEKGAKIALTFTVREGRGVTVVLMAPVDSTGADYTARIDGAIVKQDTTIQHGFGGEGTALHAQFTPVPITVKNTGWVVGSQKTIEVENTSGGPLIVNSVHPWGISPIIRVAPVLYQSAAGWALLRPQPELRITNALVDEVYRPHLAALIEFFQNPRIRAIRAELYDTLFSYLEPGLRRDGVHADVAGMLRLSKVVYEGILQPLDGTNPDDYRYLLASEAVGDGVSTAEFDQFKTALGGELGDRDEEIAARLRESSFEQFKLDLAGYQMKALAMNPEALVVGAITRNAAGAPTSAPVRWPDGVDGLYTGIPSSSTPGAIDAYSITYGTPATRTYTQPAVTRSSSGVVTNRPALDVT